MPALTSCDVQWPLFLFCCHHLRLYSSFARGKNLSNDTQMRVISSVEPKISMKMLRNLSEKLRAKFSVITHGYSMVKIAHLNIAFSELFELEASPVIVEGQSLQQIR